jgi:hypothetical protein
VIVGVQGSRSLVPVLPNRSYAAPGSLSSELVLASVNIYRCRNLTFLQRNRRWIQDTAGTMGPL